MAYKNKEDAIAYAKKYRKENAKRIKERDKLYCKKNAERIKKYCKQYREENRELLREKARQYNIINNEQCKKQKRKHYHDHPELLHNYYQPIIFLICKIIYI